VLRDQARARRHDAREGEGHAARGREDDHPRQEGAKQLGEKDKDKSYLQTYRRAIAYLRDRGRARSSSRSWASAMRTRAGGFTRIMRMHGYRIGDGGRRPCSSW
jgi:hypothetical protein